MRNILILFILVALVGFPALSEAKIKVTTTIGMVADTVKAVGGDFVEVTPLMGPGTDPHLFKASQGDIKKLSKADIIFFNGLHLEGKMTNILGKIGKRGKTVVALGETVDHKRLQSSVGLENAHDPHIWFDVDLWSQTIKTVIETLSKKDPKNKAQYEANGKAYFEKLENLHKWTKEQISTIPKNQRVLITAHDAFGYFGSAYDIEVRGLQGISTASEYGLKDIRELISFIAEKKIKAVFVESSVPKRSIEAVVEGCKKKGHPIKIGGELFSDAMGEKGTPEGTYLGMVRHNVKTIVGGLK